ncbi:MAG: aminotransferase class I/II-fold pyridoxal phosphate-dependent enzyme, partial [Terriglobia bacterium]
IGSRGGYVCGARDLIEFLDHRARPVLFSTSHPPSVTATCMAAFDLLDSPAGEKLIRKLWRNTKFFKKRLKRLGFDTGMSETPITPIIVGDAARAHQFSRELFAEGVFAQSIGYPTVPHGKARIRTIVTATHSRKDLEQALDTLERVAKRLGIL